MGANEHQRIMPLDEDPRFGAFNADGTRVRPPKRYTPEEAWGIVYDQEGYEDGHSYSGTFGSKPGMTVIARSEQLDKELLGVAGELVNFLASEGDFGSAEDNAAWSEWDPRKKKPELSQKVIAILGEDALRRAARVYDDKWGPAAAIVGKDHVWFGGYCSS